MAVRRRSSRCVETGAGTAAGTEAGTGVGTDVSTGAGTGAGAGADTVRGGSGGAGDRARDARVRFRGLLSTHSSSSSWREVARRRAGGDGDRGAGGRGSFSTGTSGFIRLS